MKLYRKFPLADVVDVPIEGMGNLKVRFKYPTVQQERLIYNEIDICQYTIAELPDIQDENGEQVTLTLKNVKDRGDELPEDVLALLVNARLHTPIAIFYLKNIRAGETEKKK